MSKIRSLYEPFKLGTNHYNGHLIDQNENYSDSARFTVLHQTYFLEWSACVVIANLLSDFLFQTT